jgi:hypothetical protein
VKGLLPDNVNVVGGANVNALRATSLYQTIIPTLVNKKSDVKRAFIVAKALCGIDLHAVVNDAVVAMGDDSRGVFVASLDKSVDQKRVVECMAKFVEKELAPKPVEKADIAAPGAGAVESKGGLKAGTKKPDPAATKPAPATPPTPPPPPPAAPKLVTKTTGKITEYGLDTDSKRIYVAWLAADVVAIATEPDDKALLEKMLAGKGAQGTLAKLLGKANQNHAIWFATTKSQPIDTGGTMKGGFGTVNTAKANVDLDITMVTSSVKDAKAFAESLNTQLAAAKAGIPPQFVSLVEALKIFAEDDRTKFKLNAPEKDLVALISVLAMGL